MRIKWGNLIPYIILIFLIIAAGVLQPNIISLDWIGIKTDSILPLALAAVGQTIVMLTGGIDLSIGGTISLINSLEAIKMTNNPINIILFTIGMCLLGMLLGAINGLIIVKIRLQPFIATLITWSIYGGLALWVLPTDRGNVPQKFIDVLLARPAGIPLSFIIIIILAVWWLYLQRTRLGKYILAVGSDEKSAYLNGVNVNMVKILAYSLSGLFASFAGIYRTAQVASGSPTAGNGFILTSAAAVIIGGTSLAGGRGTIIGSIVGAFILKIIGDILVFAGISSNWVSLFQGFLLIVIIAIVAILEMIRRRRELTYE
jgi:ribose transport system permease protein